MNFEAHASVILRDGLEVVKITPELVAERHSITQKLYENPFKRKGRSWEEIDRANEATAIEHALAQRGYPKDDAGEWQAETGDNKDADGLVYDCKKMFYADCYTFFPTSMKTTLKNCGKGCINFLVLATMNRRGDTYEVEFRALIKAARFEAYITEGGRKEGTMIFDHLSAVNHGDAILAGEWGSILPRLARRAWG